MSTLCRQCVTRLPISADGRCPACGSPRSIEHPELFDLSIAHIDCDAFYANIEKRDDPSLADKPVIVGGRHRGVVAACCYVARVYGIRSAMPMFKALKACPEAVVIPPDMTKYARVGREIRDMMKAVTPLVEPLSIDEAFLDLSGTERLHHGSPAETLARLALQIEKDVGLSVSIGLSYNKFLAKIASEIDKPRGFAVIGRSDALDFLSEKPVGIIWGVGKTLQKKLDADGIRIVGHLRNKDENELVARYGAIGRRLHQFAHGKDDRRVTPDSPTKSISAETTLDDDVSDEERLSRVLWRLTEKVAGRLKKAAYAGGTVTLKLKTKDFRLRTRSHQLPRPTQNPERIFEAGKTLLQGEADGTAFRLIGIGVQGLVSPDAIVQGDFLELARDERDSKVDDAIDAVRARLGENAVIRGRGFEGKK